MYAHQYIILSIASSICVYIVYIYIYILYTYITGNIPCKKVNYGTLWDTITSAMIKWNTVWMNHASVRQFHHHRHIQGPGRGKPMDTSHAWRGRLHYLDLWKSQLTHHFIGKVSHWEMSKLTHGWIEGSKVSMYRIHIDSTSPTVRGGCAHRQGPHWADQPGRRLCHGAAENVADDGYGKSLGKPR